MKKYIINNSIFRSPKLSIIMMVLLVVVLFSSGCGKKYEVKAPELLDSLDNNICYRPVSVKAIGDNEMLYGTVVPQSYPCFSTSYILLEDMAVSIGDYVKEGDIIAYADTEEYDNAIKESNNAIYELNEEKTLKQGLSEQTVNKLELKRKACQELGDAEGVAEQEKAIEIELENRRYETALIDSRINDENINIQKQNEKKNKLVISAPHDGYITYLFDISHGNSVEPQSNIAVISDFDDLYIEISDLNINDYKFGEYKTKYMMVDGKRMNLEEYKYSNAEVACADASKQYPPVRFKAAPQSKIGDTVPLYFIKNDIKDAIAVGNDSIYSEGEEMYVYVKEEDNSMRRQPIKTGIKDSYYTEVLSGVKEGDLVYYESSTPVPTKVTLCDIKTNTYKREFETEYYDYTATHYDIYTAQYAGDIVREDIEKEQHVNAGDEMYAISSSTGSAAVEEARVAVVNLDKEHEVKVKDFDDRQTELLAEYNAAENETMPSASDTDAMKEYLYHTERVRTDLNSLELERSSESNIYNKKRTILAADYNKKLATYSSEGVISVKAQNEGYAVSYEVNVNDSVSKGRFIIGVGNRSKDVLKVKMNSSYLDMYYTEPAKLGQSVEIKDGNKTYSATCIALNGEDGKNYLFTRNNKQYITSSKGSSDGGIIQFYVKVDTDDVTTLKNLNISFKGSEMKNVITVPSKCIYSEKDPLSEKTKNFVWKKIDDNYVKEYVTIYSSSVIKDDTLILSGVSDGDILVSE